MVRYFQEISSRGIRLLNDLGFQFPRLPKIFGLLFSDGTSHAERTVDRRRGAGARTRSCRRRTDCRRSTPFRQAQGDSEESDNRNYIGWIVGSTLDVLKQQSLRKDDGTVLTAPTALLYRLLHRVAPARERSTRR